MQAEAMLEPMDVSEDLLSLEDYTDKSFTVHGDATKTYKDYLRNMGGKFNRNLKNGPGWVFPLSKKEQVVEFVTLVNSGETPDFSSSSELPVVKMPHHQFVKYKLYLPREGMNVRLTVKGKTSNGKVLQTESSNKDGVVDTAYVDFDGQTSLAVVSRGKWQIFGYMPDHYLYFH